MIRPQAFVTGSCFRSCVSWVLMMDRSEIEDLVVELAWSLWSELGVPGVVRHHSKVAVDPEPLIAFTPRLFKLDARLRDQVFAWCATHYNRISTSRLRGLVEEEGNDEFASFAASLAARTSWPLRDRGEPWPRLPDAASPDIPMQRPALVLLRLRALSGVGARADVLGHLLAFREQRLNARMLESLGYSKRNIASILAELADAGIVTSSPQGNTRWFRLAQPETLEELAGAEGVSFWRWSAVFSLVESVLALASFSEAAQSVRRVEAHKIREALVVEAESLNLRVPPSTVGNPRAWELTVEWSVDQCRKLATGQLE